MPSAIWVSPTLRITTRATRRVTCPNTWTIWGIASSCWSMELPMIMCMSNNRWSWQEPWPVKGCSISNRYIRTRATASRGLNGTCTDRWPPSLRIVSKNWYVKTLCSNDYLVLYSTLLPQLYIYNSLYFSCSPIKYITHQITAKIIPQLPFLYYVHVFGWFIVVFPHLRVDRSATTKSNRFHGFPGLS